MDHWPDHTYSHMFYQLIRTFGVIACLLIGVYVVTTFYELYRWWYRDPIEHRLNEIEVKVIELNGRLLTMEANQGTMLRILREMQWTDRELIPCIILKLALLLLTWFQFFRFIIMYADTYNYDFYIYMAYRNILFYKREQVKIICYCK